MGASDAAGMTPVQWTRSTGPVAISTFGQWNLSHDSYRHHPLRGEPADSYRGRKRRIGKSTVCTCDTDEFDVRFIGQRYSGSNGGRRSTRRNTVPTLFECVSHSDRCTHMTILTDSRR